MGLPSAKQNDQVLAVDIHIVMVPTPSGPVPVPLPHPFSGLLDGGLATSVMIGGFAAATVDSTAGNMPPHIPTPPGATFQSPPAEKGTVFLGSVSVMVEGKGAARAADSVKTCNDPADLPVGAIVAAGTVLTGG